MTKKRIAALAAILLFAATGAEAQTGEWEIHRPTDEWGDPAPNGDAAISQTALATLITAGGESRRGGGILLVECDTTGIIGFPTWPNLEADRGFNLEKNFDQYSVPAKIDGTKGHITIWGRADAKQRTDDDKVSITKPVLTEVQESLEVLFAWGRDTQRQSLTWSMDGLREAFAEE